MAEQLELTRQYEDWGKRASELWTPDAQRVITLLGENDVVFVDAPNGSGKTHFLIPAITRLSTPLGWNTHSLDTSEVKLASEDIRTARNTDYQLTDAFQRELENLPPLRSTQKGLLILDEIGWMNDYDVLRILRTGNMNGYQKFVLIPAARPDRKDKQINELQKKLATVGKTSAVLQMPKKVIPENQSREFLEIHGSPPEVIDLIVTNFPMYLRVLDLFRGDKTIEDVMRGWQANATARGITNDEYTVVQDKLNDWLKK